MYIDAKHGNFILSFDVHANIFGTLWITTKWGEKTNKVRNKGQMKYEFNNNSIIKMKFKHSVRIQAQKTTYGQLKAKH